MEIRDIQPSYHLKKTEATTVKGKQVNQKVVTDSQSQKTSENYINVPKEHLENKVDRLNNFIKKNETSLKFQLHEELNKYYVQIVDSHSNEVVKEIPPKKFLDMYASMAELMGLFVDDKL